MSTEWERVNQLFHEVKECADEERANFIERAVQHDPALRHEVQSLIAAHDGDKCFLEHPALGESLFLQIEGLQRQIIDALRTSAGKVSVGTDGMIGQLLDGKYEIEELCGRGGMGAVYRATHVGTGRRVAVKVIAPELAGDSEFIERFRREAKTIGLLRHPNIVDVTDFGVTGAGADARTVAYLVMEYLEGQTLAERLKDRRPMPIDEAIGILSQVCDAMNEAHRLGILHRDLKPENIWMKPAGLNGSNVKVLDFGNARLQNILPFDELEPQPEFGEPVRSHSPFSITEEETLRLNYTLQQLSRFGSVMGTPKYMSPEQCRGERLDKTSDVYSLGVIAYQMLAGDPPFTGTTAELLVKHREADPAPLRKKRRDIPADVDAVIRRALAKDKNARPATAGVFNLHLQLHSVGNGWIRRQADALARKHSWSFFEIAFRMQWKGWLFSLLSLFATLTLPGMPIAKLVAVFGLVWLVIAAITIWGQSATTAACTLFLGQTDDVANPETDNSSIARAVRQRRGDLARASAIEIFSPIPNLIRGCLSLKFSEIRRMFDNTLMTPPLIQEGLSVDEARKRSALLMEPIRPKIAYPLFRRALACALGLTALQQILLASAFLLDRRYHYFNATGELAGHVSETMYFCLLTLPLAAIAFRLGLKSAIEQSMLYGAARKALGEIPSEQSPLLSRQDPEPARFRWWASWKTYAPTCAFIVSILGFHVFKLATIENSVAHGNLYSVKAVRGFGFTIRLDLLIDEWWWVRQLGRHPAMVQYLIEEGADVNVTVRNDFRGGRVYGSSGPPHAIDQASVIWNPLIAMLSAGTVEAARVLIEHGADVHAQDSFGRTPMTIAIFDCPQAIELLLASGVDINEQNRFGTPLLTAARYQWPWPESNPQNSYIRIYNNQYIRYIVLDTHERVPVERIDEILLVEQRNAVRILIEKGADPNTLDSEGRNALMLMSMESRRDKDIELTIEDRETIEPKLRYRRRDRAVELIGETLLNAGCDINAADNKGRTPLMYAAIFERPSIVNLLLKRGANINAKDHNGSSALDWARKSGNEEIIRLLPVR
jgi:serine/threonine protein kinase/ankyrin repeat protein